jgi:hypothetical protein
VAAAVFESVFEMCWRRVCKTVQPELKLRQIIPEKYVDADTFLIENDRLGPAMREQMAL